MKEIKLTLLLIAFSFGVSQAQFFEKNSLYLSSALNIGNYFGASSDINYTYKDTYSFALGMAVMARRAKSEPDDYDAGLASIFFFDLDQPRDVAINLSLSAGRIIPLNKKKTIRLNVMAGMGMMFLEEPTNWQKGSEKEPVFNFVNNYTWENEKKVIPSLVLKPKLEFHLHPFYGLYLAPELYAGTSRTYVGLSLGYMLGVLHPE